jgi:hypothetical protein
MKARVENRPLQLDAPNLETLINKRLSNGGYRNAEEVLRRAPEAQDAAGRVSITFGVNRARRRPSEYRKNTSAHAPTRQAHHPSII